MSALSGRMPIVELDDFGAVRALVKSSDALAVAHYEMIRADVDAGELAVLGVPEGQEVFVRSNPIVLATLQDRPLPPIATRTIDALTARLAAERAI